MTAADHATAVQLLRSAAADHLTHLDPAERDELVERITGALDRCAAKAWDEGYERGKRETAEYLLRVSEAARSRTGGSS